MSAEADLTGREVLLCLSGGVACYKSADLASRLVKAGAGVNVAMTASAGRFIAPLTFQALTARPVYTSLWEAPDRYDPHHIALTDRAELMIVAPATANLIAKMACGLSDELVSSLALTASGACPILVAPAMNSRMWSAPATQANMRTLAGRGCHVIGPDSGRLACGTTGPGRMAEPAEIFEVACRLLTG
jgi:phosphopantothenoylcysteine decarboxylase/phosphopantothenate--cysteine ligase